MFPGGEKATGRAPAGRFAPGVPFVRRTQEALSRSPSRALSHPFLGFPYSFDYRKKGALILTCLLGDLVVILNCSGVMSYVSCRLASRFSCPRHGGQ